MRKAIEIKRELDATLMEYRSKAKTVHPEILRPLTNKVKELQKELGAKYSEGASPCPKCGALPHGMDRSRVFEVGCLGCAPFFTMKEVTYDDGDGNQIKEIREVRTSYSAQGRTVEEAVDNWNNQVLFEEIIPKKEEEAQR